MRQSIQPLQGAYTEQKNQQLQLNTRTLKKLSCQLISNKCVANSIDKNEKR